MWPFSKPKVEEKAACPTKPCATCGNPMPIVGFDQRCPRCRTLVAASAFCPGSCSGCEMGQSAS
jgi:hypothetical protein